VRVWGPRDGRLGVGYGRRSRVGWRVEGVSKSIGGEWGLETKRGGKYRMSDGEVGNGEVVKRKVEDGVWCV